MLKRKILTGNFRESSVSGKSFSEQLPMAASVVIMYLNLHDVMNAAKYFQFIFSKGEKKRVDLVLQN